MKEQNKQSQIQPYPQGDGRFNKMDEYCGVLQNYENQAFQLLNESKHLGQLYGLTVTASKKDPSKLGPLEIAQMMFITYNRLAPLERAMFDKEEIISLTKFIPVTAVAFNDYNLMAMDWCIDELIKGDLPTGEKYRGVKKNQAMRHIYEVCKKAIDFSKYQPNKPDNPTAYLRTFFQETKKYWIENIRCGLDQAYPVITAKIDALPVELEQMFENITQGDLPMFVGCGSAEYRQTLASLVEGESVLDVGTGSGYCLPFLMEKAQRVIGIDPILINTLPVVLAYLKRQNKNVSYQQCTIEKYTEAADTVVVSSAEFLNPAKAVPHLYRAAKQKIVVGIGHYNHPVVCYALRDGSNLGGDGQAFAWHEPLRWKRELEKYTQSPAEIYSYGSGIKHVIIAQKNS